MTMHGLDVAASPPEREQQSSHICDRDHLHDVDSEHKAVGRDGVASISFGDHSLSDQEADDQHVACERVEFHLALLLLDTSVHVLGSDLSELVSEREHPEGCSEVNSVAKAQHGCDPGLLDGREVDGHVDTELVELCLGHRRVDGNDVVRRQREQPRVLHNSAGGVEPQVDEEEQEQPANARKANVPVPPELDGDEQAANAREHDGRHGKRRPDHRVCGDSLTPFVDYQR